MPKVICENCNKEFSSYPHRPQQFCSHQCHWDCKIRKQIESGSYSKATARTFFKKTTEYKCSSCGINEWNNKPITLQIDHIDGNTSNNLIENFRYLCPNCHSQTDTWSVRNMSPEGRERVKLARKLRNDIQNGRAPKGTKLKDIL